MKSKSGSYDDRASSPSATTNQAGATRRDVVVGAAALGVAATIAAPAVLAQTPQTRRVALTYYPWITQSISGPVLQSALADFASAFQSELRSALGGATDVELLKEMEVPDQLEHLEEKPAKGSFCKIALLNPIGFALVHKRSPQIDAVAVIMRKIGDDKPGPTYKAQLYTNRKTAIRNIRQMRGRTIAYGSPQSTSNFLVPAAMLWNYQDKDKDFRIHPFAGFKRVDFAGGHDTAALAVYEGRADVGAGHDGVIFDLANRPGFGDADKVLERIEFSENIPSDPVAVHTSEPALRKHILEALVKVATPGQPKSAGNQIVKRFWGTDEGFGDTSPKAYTHLVDLMQKMTLREQDLLRRM
jgi:phosphate/phosphite/phosphonate ABC transporter binding protein